MTIMTRSTWLALPLTLLMLAASCGGDSSDVEPTSTDHQPQTTATAVDPQAAAQTVEANSDPGLPGEFVDLPAIYGGPYGNRNGSNTNAHVSGPVDYSAQGLPPVGGPHWGSGSCGNEPEAAPANCGPVPCGIYRAPWPAESLVHNMEHAGVVVWYNSSDIDVRDRLENWVEDEGGSGKLVVMTPYPDIPADTIALTAWSRRDAFPVSDLTESRVKDFISKLSCRFDAENFCQ